MSTNRATWLLLSLVLPVWAVGLYHSLDVRSAQIRPRNAFGWLKRYQALEPYLAGTPKAIIVYDPTGRSDGNKRLFRAQYALAPKIFYRPRRQVPPVQPRKLPLVYDFRDKDGLDFVLRKMETKARRRGVAMRAERVARGLAVVWQTETER